MVMPRGSSLLLSPPSFVLDPSNGDCHRQTHSAGDPQHPTEAATPGPRASAGRMTQPSAAHSPLFLQPVQGQCLTRRHRGAARMRGDMARGSPSGTHMPPRGHGGIGARQGTARQGLVGSSVAPPGRVGAAIPAPPLRPTDPPLRMAQGSLPPVPPLCRRAAHSLRSDAHVAPRRGTGRSQGDPAPRGSAVSGGHSQEQRPAAQPAPRGSGHGLPPCPLAPRGEHAWLCRCRGTMPTLPGAVVRLRVCRTGRSGRW